MKIQLKSPENGSIISQMTKKQRAFMSSVGNQNAEQDLKIDWLHLVKQGEDNTPPTPVVFSWSDDFNDKEGLEIQFMISMHKSFQNKKTIRCSGCSASLDNLYLGQTYYWKVCAAKNGSTVCSSDVFCFTTALEPPRWIGAEGLSNVRDIGGWRLDNGKRIRQGLVYRGCEMEFHHIITDKGKEILRKELGIKTDLDLREEAVGKVACSALGKTDINFHLIPVKAYDAFLAESKKEACRIFRLFASRDNYPFYVHCWGGADRTGTLIFLLCAILGMAENDLYLDYELTSLSIWGERSRKSELFEAFLTALNAYDGATVNEKCQSFLLSAGITKSEIQAIRNILIQD